MAYDRPPAPSLSKLEKCSWEKPLLYSETVELNSCRAEICCTQGHRRRMEDRFVATKLSFIAAEVLYHADLIAVLDGHSTSTAAVYVQNKLASTLKTILEAKHLTRSPCEEGIYYALKEAVAELHNQIIALKTDSGTTAIIAFKLANSPELWTANIGDSTAFLARGKAAIPMSIPQKPLFFGKIEEGSWPRFAHPNAYARQLMDNGVEVFDIRHKKMAPRLLEEKMFLYYDTTDERGAHHMLLGIPHVTYLDMSRSIGDPTFLPWKKHSPEIFRQTLQPGDLLFLHSDGISAAEDVLSGLLQEDKERGYAPRDTLSFIVRSCIEEAKDNICAALVYFS